MSSKEMMLVNLTGISGKEMTLPLPDIHLTDLGKDSDGIYRHRFDPADARRHHLRYAQGVISTVTDIGKGAENVARMMPGKLSAEV